MEFILLTILFCQLVVVCYAGVLFSMLVFDITADDASKLGKFDVIHDKGTYDAISLNPEDPKYHREKYVRQVREMLADGGFFIITSCNWTEEELIGHFSEKFKLRCVIPTPQFKFGGKVGSVVSAVVFTK